MTIGNWEMKPPYTISPCFKEAGNILPATCDISSDEGDER